MPLKVDTVIANSLNTSTLVINGADDCSTSSQLFENFPFIVQPTFNKLSESSEVPMYTMSVDEFGNQDYAVQLGIRAVPTTKAFNNGGEIFSKPGMLSENELKSVIKNLING